MKNNKPLKLVFDANPLAQSNLTGIGSYEKRLIESLSKEEGERIKLIGYYYDFLGKRTKTNLPKAKNIKYKRIIIYPGSIVNLLRRFGIDIPLEFFTKSKADIALFPNYLSHPSIFGTKIIPIVYDMTHELYPQSMSPKNQKDLHRFLPKTLNRSSALITISENTKKDIVNLYDYKKEILVTPIPFENNNTTDLYTEEYLENKYEFKKDYILFVGTLEPRKNIINLVDAFCKHVQLASQYTLILCGGVDWKFDQIVKKISDAQSEGYSVISTGFVDNKTRDSFYKYCSGVVMPSIYEVFVMPILEALSYDKPIILSDIPVFHEVAENSALYFDNNSLDSIGNTIWQALQAKKILDKPSYSKIKWSTISKNVFELFMKTKN